MFLLGTEAVLSTVLALRYKEFLHFLELRGCTMGKTEATKQVSAMATVLLLYRGLCRTERGYWLRLGCESLEGTKIFLELKLVLLA